jgi:hypothetical protein
MGIPVVIVGTGEEPAIENLDAYELPDGCSGFMGIEIGGRPCAVPMPVNEARPIVERMSEYLMALSCAAGFMSYNRIKNYEKANNRLKLPREAVIGLLIHHTRACMELVARELVMHHGFDIQGVNRLTDVGFLPAHDACCPNGEACKTAIHKRVFGDSKPS